MVRCRFSQGIEVDLHRSGDISEAGIEIEYAAATLPLVRDTDFQLFVAGARKYGFSTM